MNDILAVVEWIENMLIPSLFQSNQLAEAGLGIHNEFSSAPFMLFLFIYIVCRIMLFILLIFTFF